MQLFYTVHQQGGPITSPNSQMRTSTDRLRETESHSSGVLEAGFRPTSVTSASVLLLHSSGSRAARVALWECSKADGKGAENTILSLPGFYSHQRTHCLMKSLTQNTGTMRQHSIQATLGSPSTNILLSIQKSIVLVGELCFPFQSQMNRDAERNVPSCKPLTFGGVVCYCRTTCPMLLCVLFMQCMFTVGVP